MIDPSARKITAFIACRKNPDTKIYILSITHIRETTQGFIHIFPHSHIKTPRIECIQMSPASSDPSCRKERSHRVIDRFLYSGKRSLRQVSKNLELDETRKYLEDDINRDETNFMYQNAPDAQSLGQVINHEKYQLQIKDSNGTVQQIEMQSFSAHKFEPLSSLSKRQSANSISNLIGGVQVSLLRIVSPGDNISVGGAAGVVKDVNWRHTTITNSKGEMVVIPNSIINKTSLVHLPPTGKVTLSLVVEGGGEDLDERAGRIEQAALAAARRVGAVEAAPRLWFTEVVDGGFAGSLIFTMASGDDATPAKDAVLRAIAPLTRQ